jgi:hypothetical protein
MWDVISVTGLNGRQTPKQPDNYIETHIENSN